MENDSQSTQVVPMEEDENTFPERAETAVVCVEEEVGKGEGVGEEQEQIESVHIEPLEEDMSSCYLVSDGEGDGGVELIEIHSDYSLDDEDMEIQRLTQSLQELGTGRIQRSLITDQPAEVQINVTFEDK
ncbi:uncharacterized protein LOC124171349 [Ischnura elegans]|uniref:uncharacterized protein LOC124171349 n=1 Tax=Ischnura elegans TaxID=197161 RepID=UPI001ED8B0AE|nr:uncharacterized protein LOC124171349 [Ischnura elegans]XP_046406464.1 uncharacterized protein LOC124171349 [Ischnura elegans]